ncbi:MAG: hypothetical protein EBR81_09885 [Proteobacteria bacterium]|nr:hypothetical protein [Pseudomonadota bacterium]
MNLDEFIQSAAVHKTPPAGLAAPLVALWHAEKGDWHAAHNIAQDIHNKEGSWIHAHLHREEGDLWNARYWYERAGRAESKKPLPEERREMIASLLT